MLFKLLVYQCPPKSSCATPLPHQLTGDTAALSCPERSLRPTFSCLFWLAPLPNMSEINVSKLKVGRL